MIPMTGTSDASVFKPSRRESSRSVQAQSPSLFETQPLHLEANQ